MTVLMGSYLLAVVAGLALAAFSSRRGTEDFLVELVGVPCGVTEGVAG